MEIGANFFTRITSVFLIILLSAFSFNSAAHGYTNSENYNFCIYGIADLCDESKLTEAQKAEVAPIRDKNNFKSCLLGLEKLCNKGRLTSEQRAQIHKIALERNFKACMLGLDLSCDKKQLTELQSKKVQVEEEERNFTYCLFDMPKNCNRQELSPSQLQLITEQQKASSNNNSGAFSNVPASGPICAENGSCRGDISKNNNSPKTIYVNGYYRKDGTYVKAHYRSRKRN
jgi:hypothetical protein